MGRLENFTGEMLVMKYEGKEWDTQVPMGLIYVPKNNTKLVKEIL